MTCGDEAYNSPMADFRRKRSHLRLPIWTTVVLALLNLSLMLWLIVELAQQNFWLGLILGTIALGISLFGISFYSFLTIKEIQLNRRQSNFVDSVTHELKTPIAALRLYLDTLLMRDLSKEDQQEFYQTMETELERLDQLINQLLEVGRLDEIGAQTEPEYVGLDGLLRGCAEAACRHHKKDLAEVCTFDVPPLAIKSQRMLMEMVFGNLIDNAVKYGGRPPRVHITADAKARDQVVVQIRDNGSGIPDDQRSNVFQMFFRGNDELERTHKGTGLGLYIVRTLVGIMKGRITITDAPDGVGCVFQVLLPGKLIARHDEEKTDQPANDESAASTEMTETVGVDSE